MKHTKEECSDFLADVFSKILESLSDTGLHLRIHKDASFSNFDISTEQDGEYLLRIMLKPSWKDHENLYTVFARFADHNKLTGPNNTKYNYTSSGDYSTVFDYIDELINEIK